MADPNATICAACGTSGELHEHHLVPRSSAGIHSQLERRAGQKSYRKIIALKAMASRPRLTAWDESGEAEGCAYRAENGYSEPCGRLRLGRSSYCPRHHALCSLPLGSAAERHKLLEFESLANIVGGRVATANTHRPDPPARFLKRLGGAMACMTAAQLGELNGVIAVELRAWKRAGDHRGDRAIIDDILLRMIRVPSIARHLSMARRRAGRQLATATANAGVV